MGTILKIKSIGLAKLNNAEYSNFMTRFRGLIPAEEENDRPDIVRLSVTDDTLVGITAAQINAFDSDLALLIDLVNQSRISDETAEMLDVDKQRDDLVVFITSTIAQLAKSPLPAQRAAAQTLYNVIKPYIGIYKSANQQETAQILGLLADLAKADMPSLINTLGLTDVIASLRTVNDRYATLTAQRTNNRASGIKENSVAVRNRLDALYDDMSTLAFVQSISSPNSATSTFIVNLNELIGETTALYNQRIAQVKKKDGPEDRPIV